MDSFIDRLPGAPCSRRNPAASPPDNATILFFGAALTKARLLASGRQVVPRPTAVRVREELIKEAASA